MCCSMYLITLGIQFDVSEPCSAAGGDDAAGGKWRREGGGGCRGEAVHADRGADDGLVLRPDLDRLPLARDADDERGSPAAAAAGLQKDADVPDDGGGQSVKVANYYNAKKMERRRLKKGLRLVCSLELRGWRLVLVNHS